MSDTDPTRPVPPAHGHQTDHHRECAHTWSRRRVLVAGATGAAVSLAGCLGGGDGGDGGTAPDAVPVEEGWTCDVCGMVLSAQPGPNAEVFYADDRPNDHDNPARFCSTWEAFQFAFDRADDGWRREAFYVTDYSTVDYDVYTEGGDQLITSHAGADAFTDATGVTFAVESDVKGAMGKDLIGFSAAADADAFVDEYGGEVVPFAEVTRDTIAGLGM
jgi:nitrous oxide reductase accessory protein NosL